VADLSLQVQLGRQVALTDDDTAATVLEKARVLAEGLLESTVRPVTGLGLALSGVVNTRTGAIERITDFHGIDELPMTEHLSTHLALPIFADNMMHASALAEYHYGIGRTVPDFIYVGLSEGVGAAVVSGGRKVGSVHASGGEFGHMSIDYRGPACSCGSRGCLELYASMPRLIAGINAACGTEYVTAKEALAVCLTDERAGAVLVEVLDTLAIGVNNLVNLLDVFTVVIGDDSAHIPDSYLAGMEDELNEISLFRGFHHITVLKSGFGDSAPLFGSVALVMERIFTGDHPLW
jgi:predicted NBD/HSP70 family sugar kinase